MIQFNIHKFIFIVVVALLFLYLKGEMTINTFDEIKISNPFVAFIILSLVFITFFYSTSQIKLLSNKPSIVKTLTLFFIVTYIISILYSLFSPFGSRFTYGLLFLPLSTFWFFYLINIKVRNNKLIIAVMIVLTIGLIYIYYNTYSERLNYYKEDTVSNASYFVMYMLPFLLCSKNKIFKYASIVIVSLVVFSSFKRTGTIAVIMAVLAYFYVEIGLLGNKKYKNIILLVAGISLITYYIINSNILSDNFLFTRLQNISEDKGSGRIEIWQKTWKMIEESNIYQLIMGHGFNSVVKNSPLKLSAHNDFLEVLYDYGIIVWGIYLSIYFSLLKFLKKLILQKSMYAAPIASSIVLFFIGSISSHIVIYPYYFIMFTMFWGFVLGNGKNKLKFKKLNLELKQKLNDNRNINIPRSL